jgi:hypothetical protein
MATDVNVQLWIRFGDEYQHALSIPLQKCQEFALHPLTWLRFLGYAIYGKEGHISRERDGEQVADYRPEGAAISAGNYYYISQGELFRATRDLSLTLNDRQRLSFARSEGDG